MSEAEAKDAERIDKMVGEWMAYRGANTGGNAQTIHVTLGAGGIGVWIAATCCLLMLVVGIREFDRQAAEIAALKQNDKSQAAYLSAIYAQAPHLKPKEK